MLGELSGYQSRFCCQPTVWMLVTSAKWFISSLLCLFTVLSETFFFPFPKLIIAMEELKQCRLQQRNISATVDKLTLCLPGEESEIALYLCSCLF